ncbi:NAD kinase [Micrococcoides hystricis]|uniref:NAD kinase n=1 Tax=Micrococcoides hystricis TaxID=1572761 RepID=A0ABV6P8S0_9MICC
MIKKRRRLSPPAPEGEKSKRRRILLLAHTGRSDAIEAAIQTCHQLLNSDLIPVMLRRDMEQIEKHSHRHQSQLGILSNVEILGINTELPDIMLCMVLGGDGSVLRAAEFVHGYDIPILAVNLGHVGFLAESERSDQQETVQRVVEDSYTVEERMSIDVKVWHNNELIAQTWALNEASVEKINRERMLEAVIEVDARPISTFGCDGVVLATPTGSTAYAFSAGGPVVWPEVDALLLVPISAHALFARPMVIAPTSVMAVEILSRTESGGVLWCDGRRMVELPPGARVEATRSPQPVKLARVNRTPFAERLVRKFELPTTGWRGPAKTEQQHGPTELEHQRRASGAVTEALKIVEPRNITAAPPVTGRLNINPADLRFHRNRKKNDDKQTDQDTDQK